jgi:hypothetical protein
MFRRNVLAPSSGSKSKGSKKPADKLLIVSACVLLRGGSLLMSILVLVIFTFRMWVVSPIRRKILPLTSGPT